MSRFLISKVLSSREDFLDSYLGRLHSHLSKRLPLTPQAIDGVISDTGITCNDSDVVIRSAIREATVDAVSRCDASDINCISDRIVRYLHVHLPAIRQRLVGAANEVRSTVSNISWLTILWIVLIVISIIVSIVALFLRK